MSLAAWCRSKGIDGRSLRAWAINLERGATGAGKRSQMTKPVQLIELVPAVPARRPGRYVVHVGHHAIEVDDQFAETTLRRLVAVLASC